MQGDLNDSNSPFLFGGLASSLRPEVVPAVEGPLSLDEISYWCYVIQDVPESLDELERSRYEILVIEPMRTDHSETESRNFDTAAAVARLKASAGNDGVHRKLVIAYIDIGQAEDWRWYWDWSQNSEWDPADEPKPADWPSWIITHDPEWIGNFPVAYWHEDWRRIVVDGGFSHNGRLVQGDGYSSILEEVVNDGFDGVYLDWVEAFSDQAVAEAAMEAGEDPETAMLNLIEAMRNYGRERFSALGKNPDDWIIIQQNAPDLADSDDPRRFTVIDGIAEEGIWWEGLGDAAWDDPAGYDSSARRKLGREWYENVLYDWLPAYQQAGIPVFACEYALENAADVYKNLAPGAGFIPYCTRRSLSQLSTTPPEFD